MSKRLLMAMLLSLAVRLSIGFGLAFYGFHYHNSDPLGWLSFKLLGPDAVEFHNIAADAALAWSGQSIEKIWDGWDIRHLSANLPLAVTYYIFGSYFPLAIILNSLYFFAIGLFAYRLALVLTNNNFQSFFAALLIANWPPSFSYTTIPLRDAFWLFTVFLSLLSLAMAYESGVGTGLNWRSSFWIWFIVMITAVYLTVSIKDHFGLNLAWLSVVVGLTYIIRERRLPIACHRAIVLTPLIAFTVLFSIWIGFLWPLGIGIAPNISNYVIQHSWLTETEPAKETSKSSVDSTPIRQVPLPSSRIIAQKPPNTKPVYEPPPKLKVGDWFRQARGYISSKLVFIVVLVDKLRKDFRERSGTSLSPEASLSAANPANWGTLLLAALRYVWLFPSPWEKWPDKVGFGFMQIAVKFQAIFWWMIIPGLVWGIGTALKRNVPVALLIILWCFVLGLISGLIVVNLGTLYRFRDMVILPMILFFSFRPYQFLWQMVCKFLYFRNDSQEGLR